MNPSHSRRPRLRAQLWVALFVTVVGCGLLIAGFVVPPSGEIHPSVLVALGELFTFAGSLFGIDYRYKSKPN